MKKAKKTLQLMLSLTLVAALCGCSTSNDNIPDNTGNNPPSPPTEVMVPDQTPQNGNTGNTGTATGTVSDSLLVYTDMFTERDLRQSADLSEAVYYQLEDNTDITITEEGVYVISGSASEVTIRVDAADAKVQLVLNGVSITNADSPAIYVLQADKVFVTTTETENTLTVTSAFKAEGTTNTDAVIFSKDDLVINGLGTLKINSTENGISCKDDLKITGSTIVIKCTEDAMEANDSIRIAGGSITIETKKDGLHAENDDDNSLGYVYITDAQLTITAGDDGIHATTIAQIDGGDITISAAEGIEATVVQINDGNINISASDDGINGARKSSYYSVSVTVNGGSLTINMGQGDTDGIDSNGNLYINGGTISINAQSPFDYDGTASYTGGTIIVNGQQTNSITNQMMGGGGFPGGNQGGQGGFPGGNQGGGHGGHH